MRARNSRILVLFLLLSLPAPAFARAAGAKSAPKTPPANATALQRSAMATPGGGKHVELTVFNGFQTPKDLYVTGEAKVGLRDNYAWGGRVAYHTSAKLGIEASFTRDRSDLEARSAPAGFADTTALGGIVVDQYELGVVMSDAAKENAKSVPFLSAGIGQTRFEGDVPVSSGSASSRRFAWHVGMGSKIKMGQQLSLRLEARYRSTNTNPRSPLYTDMRGNEFSYDPSWYHSLEVTGGLTYRIGG